LLLLLTVDEPDTSSCKSRGRITVHGSSGYLSNLASPAPSSTTTVQPPPDVGSARPGSESCPWTIIVRPGQTVALRVIVLPLDVTHGKTSSGGPPRRASDYNQPGVGYGCAASFVIREPPLSPTSSEDVHADDVDVAAERLRRHHYSVCARNSRERHLYTSAGNSVSVHVTSTRFTGAGHSHHANRVPASSRAVIPRFIISYEGMLSGACPGICCGRGGGTTQKVSSGSAAEPWWDLVSKLKLHAVLTDEVSGIYKLLRR